MVAGAKGEVFLLDIGPASRRAYAQYRNFLKSHHATPATVITKLDYADKAFQFSFEGWINQPMADAVREALKTDEPKMITNAFDKPRQVALPAPKAETAPPPAPPSERNPPLQGEVIHPQPRPRGRPPGSRNARETGSIAGDAFAAATSTNGQSAPAQQFGIVQNAPKPPDNIQADLDAAFGFGR
jgi:hypothetical protein